MLVLHILTGSTSKGNRTIFGRSFKFSLQSIVLNGVVRRLFQDKKGLGLLHSTLGFIPGLGRFVFNQPFFGVCRGDTRVAIEGKGSSTLDHRVKLVNKGSFITLSFAPGLGQLFFTFFFFTTGMKGGVVGRFKPNFGDFSYTTSYLVYTGGGVLGTRFLIGQRGNKRVELGQTI